MVTLRLFSHFTFNIKSLWDKGRALSFWKAARCWIVHHNCLPTLFLSDLWENLLDGGQTLSAKDPAFHVIQAPINTSKEHIYTVILFTFDKLCTIIWILPLILITLIQFLPQGYHLIVVDNNLAATLLELPKFGLRLKDLGGVLQIWVGFLNQIPDIVHYWQEQVWFCNSGLHGVEELGHHQRILRPPIKLWYWSSSSQRPLITL